MVEEIEIRKVFKQGDSVVVSIPKRIVEKLGLKDGDFLKVRLNGEVICIERYFE